MERRRFLTLIAAGAASAVGAGTLARPTAGAYPLVIPPLPPIEVPTIPGMKTLLGPGMLNALPGTGMNIALTIDGVETPEVVWSLLEFAYKTGARFTVFVTGVHPAWIEHRVVLQRFVNAGLIQLANRTWDDPDLSTLSEQDIADQLRRTQGLLEDNYGVETVPYFRSPDGVHSPLVDKVAADLGYTVPVGWTGVVDAPDEDAYVDQARVQFQPQAIVRLSAAGTPLPKVYDRLVEIVKERRLTLVTLNDLLSPIK